MPVKVKERNRLIESNGHHPTVEADQSERVELKAIDIREFDITLVGTSPLIVHKFSEKAKKSIEDKQQKKAKTAKEARDPKAEYLAAFYMMPDSPAPETKGAKYGIPACGLKHAAVAACSFIDGITKVVARGAFHVLEQDGGMVEIISKSGPRMREDTVRIGMGTLDLRYRPEFTDWATTARVRYNASVISPEQIINLFNVAGFAVGLFEWRPQKNGSYGMFAVKSS